MLNSTAAATAKSPSTIAGASTASHTVVDVAAATAATAESQDTVAASSAASYTVAHVAASTAKSPSAVTNASSDCHFRHCQIFMHHCWSFLCLPHCHQHCSCHHCCQFWQCCCWISNMWLGCWKVFFDWSSTDEISEVRMQQYAHHVSAIDWVTCNNLPEVGNSTLCCEYHEQYNSSLIRAASTPPSTTSPFNSKCNARGRKAFKKENGNSKCTTRGREAIDKINISGIKKLTEEIIAITTILITNLLGLDRNTQIICVTTTQHHE